MPNIGVVGSLVWDEIYGRESRGRPVEEWGGIAYALAGFDAALPPDWHIVPLIKVGRDLAPQAATFLGTLSRVAPGSRFAEVLAGNNRVVLRYDTPERRCERMAGGVPPWTWDELGPMVRDLDALYVNFISGFELGLGTATALRHGFRGPIYADLHSLFLAMGQDGMRSPQPLPNVDDWFACFDVAQMNETEMQQLSRDPLEAAGRGLAAGLSALLVTLGKRGAVYIAAPGFRTLGDRAASGFADRQSGVVRTARIDAPVVDDLDPTGCGDVFGATVFSELLSGADIEVAVTAGTRAAARNATYRGATGLAAHLRGSLVAP